MKGQPLGREVRLHFTDYWRTIRLRLHIIALVFGLAVSSAAVATYLMPRQYKSMVVMEVTEQDQKIRIFDGDGFHRPSTLDPRFATTQFQIIQRKEMLYPVIDTLGLVEKWSKSAGVRNKEDAYFKLRRMVDVREVRNTNLLQISVESQDPSEAASLANSIAEQYQKKRIEAQQKLVEASLSTLEEEVSKQRDKVSRANAEMARLRSELGITDLNPDSLEDPLQAQEKVLLEQERSFNEAKMKASLLRTKYAEIEKLSGDDLIRALPTLEIEDQTVSKIMPQYQETESELARTLRSGLGRNHPAVKSLLAKKEAYARQLSEQSESIRRTLSANLEISDQSLSSMETQLESQRSSFRTSKSRGSEYAAAKSAYIQAKKILESAELRLSTETMQRSMPLNPARMWERAEPATAPHSPKVMANMVLSAVVALIIGIGLAFFLEYLDTSVKTMEDVESFLSLPVLAVVPQNVSFSPDNPDAPDAEAYRILRTNIEFNRPSAEANTVTFVSGAPGEGKSTTLANLAFTFAQGGYNTLVVDADLRRPTQHRLFGVPNERGLTDFIESGVPLAELVAPTAHPGLSLLPSGKPTSDAMGTLHSQRMIDLLNEVKSRFDIVFFDAPPILGVSDASILVRVVDLTVMVVQHRRFPRAMLSRVKQAVVNAGGQLLGVVLNNVDVRHDPYYEYQTGYYQYYAPTPRPRLNKFTRQVSCVQHEY